jgi:predicted HicB family RNase H-like nuclease
MAERKRGRPSKGVRKRIPLKVPVPLAELIEEQARRNGVYVNDWVMDQLARSLGYSLNRQEQLPLNDAA